jgi:hypothetical protein
VWIVGLRDSAVTHGVYDWLDRMGARWYFPNALWTFIPTRADAFLDADLTQLVRPVFRTMTTWASMQYGAPIPAIQYDPAAKRAAFDLWLQRNRFPVETGFAGPSYAATLAKSADPLWRAQLADGTRPSPAAKPDYTHHATVPCGSPNAVVTFHDAAGDHCEDPSDYSSHGGFVGQFIQDRTQALVANPTAIDTSVDPSDGGGHCQCQKCRDLLRKGPYPHVDQDSSISDRVFHLANQVAQMVDPQKTVSLLAYNYHAAPPTIPLEPNMIVPITAYGLQRSGLPPEELIAAWAQKSAQNPKGPFRSGIYDYVCIPQWTGGMPFPVSNCGVSYTTDKVRSWIASGLRYADLESGDSAGADGLTHYFISRLSWDPQAKDADMRAEFIARAFGPAAAPMARLLGRWAAMLPSAEELGLSYQDLGQAIVLARASGDAGLIARVDAYRAYLHYVRLYVQWLNGGQTQADADKLVQFAWRIRDTGMLQSYAVVSVALNRYPALATEWNAGDPNSAYASLPPPPSSADLDQLVPPAGQTPPFPPLGLVHPYDSNHYVPLASPAPKAGMVRTQYTDVPQEFAWVTSSARTIQVNLASSSLDTGLPPTRLEVFDPSGARTFVGSVPPGNNAYALQTFSIPLSTAGQYRVRVWPSGAYFFLETPADLPFAATGDYAETVLTATRHYFYVPSGITSFAIYADATPTNFFAPDGTAVTPQRSGVTWIFDVTPDRAGKVWSFSNMESRQLVFLNLPQLVSFDKSLVIIPDNLLGLVPLQPSPPSGAPLRTQYAYRAQSYTFVAAAARTVALNLLASSSDAAAAPVSVSVTDASGAVIYSGTAPAGLSTYRVTPISLAIAQAGTYQMTVDPGSAVAPTFYALDVPADLPLALVGAYHEDAYVPNAKRYFFVPRGQASFSFDMDCVTTPVFYDPNGNAVAAQKSGTVYQVPTGGLDGAVWAFSDVELHFASTLGFVDVPAVVSYSAATELVPGNLAR